MVDDEAYCVDVLTQVAAVTKALEGVSLKLLADHTNHCVRDAVERGRQPRPTRRSRSCSRPSSASRGRLMERRDVSARARRRAPRRRRARRAAAGAAAQAAPDGALHRPPGPVLRAAGAARYGETFTLRLYGPGDVVFLSDPASLKRLFAADRVQHDRPRAQHHPAAAARAALAAAAGGRASTCAGAS